MNLDCFRPIDEAWLHVLLSKNDHIAIGCPVFFRAWDQWAGCLNQPPPKLSVVIPVHNEKGTILDVVNELKRGAQIHSLQMELILVDDASTDGTGDLLTVQAEPMVVLRNPQRRGSGWSRRLGCKLARGEWIGWIDGDATYAPSDLFKLFQMADGYDQVVGARRVDFGRLSKLRTFVKGLNCQIASMLWDRKITDLNSGIRIFRKSSLMKYLAELPDGFSCATTATLAALNRGHELVEVPITYRPRSSGGVSKFHPVFDTFRLWKVIWRQSMRRHQIPSKGIELGDLEIAGVETSRQVGVKDLSPSSHVHPIR